MTLIIIIIVIIAIAHLFTIDKKHLDNLDKNKLIKVSQKEGNITYLYKSANIIFLLYLKLYQNFKNHHGGKLNKTYLVNICFA